MKRLALALLLAMPLFAIAREAAAPTTETDEARFVRLTRELEQQPLTDAPDPNFGWLLNWATETPDYVVTVCMMAGPDWDMRDPFAGKLLVIASAGNMAWQIEHGADGDELSKQLAGTETALRIYRATIAQDPSKKSAFFDSLVAKRDAGTLRAYLAPFVAENCVDQQDSGKIDV